MKHLSHLCVCAAWVLSGCAVTGLKAIDEQAPGPSVACCESLQTLPLIRPLTPSASLFEAFALEQSTPHYRLQTGLAPVAAFELGDERRKYLLVKSWGRWQAATDVRPGVLVFPATVFLFYDPQWQALPAQPSSPKYLPQADPVAYQYARIPAGARYVLLSTNADLQGVTTEIAGSSPGTSYTVPMTAGGYTYQIPMSTPRVPTRQTVRFSVYGNFSVVLTDDINWRLR